MAALDGKPGGDLWGTITKGVGMLGGGGALSALGSYLGGELFGGDGKSSSRLDGAKEGMQFALDNAEKLTQNSMYNAAGDTGADVKRNHATALDSLQNSVKATTAANRLDRLGDNMLSSVGSNNALAQQQAGMASGDIRRDTTNTLRSAGVGPASIVAASGKIGQAAGQTALGLQAQASQNAMQAQSGAGQMYAQGQDMLTKDLALRNDVYVKPYEAQVNQGVGSLANQLSSQGAQGQADKIIHNPLAGVAQGLGMLGGGVIRDSMGWANTDGDANYGELPEEQTGGAGGNPINGGGFRPRQVHHNNHTNQGTGPNTSPFSLGIRRKRP